MALVLTEYDFEHLDNKKCIISRMCARLFTRVFYPVLLFFRVFGKNATFKDIADTLAESENCLKTTEIKAVRKYIDKIRYSHSKDDDDLKTIKSYLKSSFTKILRRSTLLSLFITLAFCIAGSFSRDEEYEWFIRVRKNVLFTTPARLFGDQSVINFMQFLDIAAYFGAMTSIRIIHGLYMWEMYILRKIGVVKLERQCQAFITRAKENWQIFYKVLLLGIVVSIAPVVVYSSFCVKQHYGCMESTYWIIFFGAAIVLEVCWVYYSTITRGFILAISFLCILIACILPTCSSSHFHMFHIIERVALIAGVLFTSTPQTTHKWLAVRWCLGVTILAIIFFLLFVLWSQGQSFGTENSETFLINKAR